jgi:hypothetical protein
VGITKIAFTGCDDSQIASEIGECGINDQFMSATSGPRDYYSFKIIAIKNFPLDVVPRNVTPDRVIHPLFTLHKSSFQKTIIHMVCKYCNNEQRKQTRLMMEKGINPIPP